MRFRKFYLLLWAFLVVAGAAPAKQAAPASGKDAGGQNQSKTASPPPAEKWTALGDIKSGLAPRGSVEIQRDEQPDFVRQLIRVQWRMNDPIDLWVIRPKVTGKVPVVLYLYGYPDSSDRFHDNGWGKRATAEGFAAVGFVSALTDYRFKNRPMRQWFVSELAESLGSSVHDVQLILNYLADRSDLDMDHVGMFGMGSGASIAILAAKADSRIKTLDLLDPWGDWPDWLRESPAVKNDERSKYLTPEFLKSVVALDPVAYLPSLQTPSLRLQQTLSEPVTPEVAKARIAAAMPERSQQVKYQNAGDLLKAWKIAGLSGWIKQQMRSQITKGSGDDRRAALTGVRP
jgi:hypothetical protein